MRPKLLLACTLAAATLLLTGCLVPERFTARVQVQPDAAYSYRFDGTVVNAIAIMKLRKQGVLSEKDHQGLAAEAEQLGRDPDVKRAVYKGNARYLLEMEGKREPGQSLKLLDMLTVQTDADGVMTIAAKLLTDKELNELEQLGITVNGTLLVSLPQNAEVIAQNASTTPAPGQPSYRWKIGPPGALPEIKIRIKR